MKPSLILSTHIRTKTRSQSCTPPVDGTPGCQDSDQWLLLFKGWTWIAHPEPPTTIRTYKYTQIANGWCCLNPNSGGLLDGTWVGGVWKCVWVIAFLFLTTFLHFDRPKVHRVYTCGKNNSFIHSLWEIIIPFDSCCL